MEDRLKISYSAAELFRRCPALWAERYIAKLVKSGDVPKRDFGARFHKLLENFYAKSVQDTLDIPLTDIRLEAECQGMLEAYRAHYREEPFEVIDVEKWFELPLPNSTHTLTGKIDMVVRDKATRELRVFETKTQDRNSTSNTPDKVAVTDQIALYLWAAERVYGESFGSVLYNVCVRQSEKGQVGPSFWRDNLERDAAQREKAIADITWVASNIEIAQADFGEDTMAWPFNRSQCVFGRTRCDFYLVHLLGKSAETLRGFEVKT